MEPWGRELVGRVEERWFDSELLATNPLGDPARRPVYVYLPPGYDTSGERYPSIYLIQGLSGQVDMWRNRSAFRPNAIELIDALFAGGDVPPCVVVMVDCWTSLGGSQFVDSPGRAGTTRTCVTRSCRGSMASSARSPTPHTVGSRASRVVGTGR